MAKRTNAKQRPRREQPSARLMRFGVSMEADLLKAFDTLIERKGYTNRSEAIRDLVREKLIETQWQEGKSQTAGAVCLVYDHHVPDLATKLTRIQHEVGKQIISALHVHLDHRNCLEVIVLRGQGSRLRQIADQLASTRGVKYGKLMMASTGRDLA